MGSHRHRLEREEWLGAVAVFTRSHIHTRKSACRRGRGCGSSSVETGVGSAASGPVGAAASAQASPKGRALEGERRHGGGLQGGDRCRLQGGNGRRAKVRAGVGRAVGTAGVGWSDGTVDGAKIGEMR